VNTAAGHNAVRTQTRTPVEPVRGRIVQRVHSSQARSGALHTLRFGDGERDVLWRFGRELRRMRSAADAQSTCPGL
jgi:hypothetical protein